MGDRRIELIVRSSAFAGLVDVVCAYPAFRLRRSRWALLCPPASRTRWKITPNNCDSKPAFEIETKILTRKQFR